MKMRNTRSHFCLLILFASLFAATAGATVAQKKPATKGAAAAASQPPKARAARGEEALKAELETLLKLP
jgi:hypothetical protein